MIVGDADKDEDEDADEDEDEDADEDEDEDVDEDEEEGPQSVAFLASAGGALRGGLAGMTGAGAGARGVRLVGRSGSSSQQTSLVPSMVWLPFFR